MFYAVNYSNTIMQAMVSLRVYDNIYAEIKDFGNSVDGSQVWFDSCSYASEQGGFVIGGLPRQDYLIAKTFYL